MEISIKSKSTAIVPLLILISLSVAPISGFDNGQVFMQRCMLNGS
jgi:hypothetical protein